MNKKRLSKSLDVFIEANSRNGAPAQTHLHTGKKIIVIASVETLIVGSGYGGSIAAHYLMEKSPNDSNTNFSAKVMVLERGKEYLGSDFANDLGHLPGMIKISRPGGAGTVGYPDALFDIRMGDAIDVLSGSGLGGTSLINASVAKRSDLRRFKAPVWPAGLRGLNKQQWDTLYQKTEALLGVNRIDEQWLSRHPRHRALALLAPRPQTRPAALRSVHHTRAEAAPITVEMVGEEACTLCGNCVIGCSIGAKKSVAHRLLKEDPRLDVVTDATVVAIKPVNNGTTWQVFVRRTSAERSALENEHFIIIAKNVILSAGTLGSTEILSRSEKLGYLTLSAALGSRFSTNGDAIAMGFGQSSAVASSGAKTQAEPLRTPGPTIMSVLDVDVDLPGACKPVSLTIENGAIPYALTRIFGEMVTTAAQFGRLGSVEIPAYYKKNNLDPLRVSDASIEHSQLLLVMGDDGAAGHLKWHNEAGGQSNDNLYRGTVSPEWPDVAENQALRAADHYFKSTAKARVTDWLTDRKTGFDGGQYVPNPLWRIVPEQATAQMSGVQPGGRVVTVHPLGGCPMADSGKLGVVNEFGQVFQRHSDDSKRLYRGLYVLDGSIIPAAIGTNPFLTISAIVVRAMENMLATQPLVMAALPMAAPVVVPKALILPSEKDQKVQKVQKDKKESFDTVLGICEVLYGNVDPEKLDIFNDIAKGDKKRLAQVQGLIMVVETEPFDAGEFLADNHSEIKATLKIYANPRSPEHISEQKLLSVPKSLLVRQEPIATLTGHIRFFPKDKPNNNYKSLVHTLRALHEYQQRRMRFDRYILKAVRQRLQGKATQSTSVWDEFKAFWNVAMQQGIYKKIEYHFEADKLALTITGTKEFGYGSPHRYSKIRNRLWDVWTQITFNIETGNQHCSARMTVDMDYEQAGTPIIMDPLPSLNNTSEGTRNDHLVNGLLASASVFLFYFRNVFSTYFWEFGAPDYQDMDRTRDLRPRTLTLGNGRKVCPESIKLQVPLATGSNVRISIELTRYCPSTSGKPGAGTPVLLIHGLAQGSLIYSTQGIRNMATSFWEEGHDVWLLDYRLSNRIIDRVPQGDWSFEEIAQCDIPAAVEYVFQATEQPVSIFAHCVGATVVTMGVLEGWLDNTWISRIAFNAIHPWIEPSPVNRFRAFLGSFFRDAMAMPFIDPIPTATPSVQETLLDRCAYSLARFEEETADIHSTDSGNAMINTICDRMSAFYGRMWRHENLHPSTHADFINLVGPAPASVYRHLYYFVMRGRITNNVGENNYLNEEKISKNWTFPTLFLHGESSHVFNPWSARRSAKNMKKVLGDDAKISLRIVPNYGHMDVIFGKKAHDDVFLPTLAHFFGDKSP